MIEYEGFTSAGIRHMSATVSLCFWTLIST